MKYVTKGCIYYINVSKPYKFMDLQTKYPTNIPQNAVILGASLILSWRRWVGSSSGRVPCFMGAYITPGQFWALLRTAVITSHQLRFRWLKRLLIVTPRVRSRHAAWHRREAQVAGCDLAWSGIWCASPLQRFVGYLWILSRNGIQEGFGGTQTGLIGECHRRKKTRHKLQI